MAKEEQLSQAASDESAKARHLNEQLLLFSLIVDDHARDEVLWRVKREWFYDGRHQKIISAIQSLSERNQPIDAVVLATELSTNGQLDDVGGVAYLCELGEMYANTGLVSFHAKVVREQWIKREAKYAGIELVKMVNADQPLETIIEQCEATLGSVCETAVPQTVIDVQQLLVETMHDIDQRIQTQRQAGIPIGFRDIDAVLGGIQGGETIIIAARPGVGKTSLACSITLNLCRDGLSVLFLAMETSRIEWMSRMLSIEAQVDGEVIKDGMRTLDDTEREITRESLMQAASRINGYRLFLDETASQPIRAIIGNSRRHKRRYGLDCIVIDYLQLIEPEHRGNVPREQQVATFSRKLKQLAKELNVPVIVLAQINREAEKRNSACPRLSDLRESGSIEQDADKVIFLYRETTTEEQEADGHSVMVEVQGRTFVSVAKNRNGKTHSAIEINWDASRTTFSDMSVRQADVATRASNLMGNRTF